MSRIYLVVKHVKKEDRKTVLYAFYDKHLAKDKVKTLEDVKHKKTVWFTIEKYDIVDTEEALQVPEPKESNNFNNKVNNS